MQLQQTTITCPYCGETFETQADPSAGHQQYIEDCQVCCRPIEVQLHTDGESCYLEARRDDD